MKSFLIDKQNTYTYDLLLSDLNSSEKYYPLYRTDDLYDYFLNFILALVSNEPLILIDSDVNSSKVENIDVDIINTSKSIKNRKFRSICELIEEVVNSNSQITLYTSGTTGQPKKVVHSVQTLIRNVRISVNHQNHIWGFAYNPTHMAGLQVFFQAFLNSNTLINIFNQNRIDVYNTIEKHLVSHMSATPTFYRLLLPYEKSFKSVVRVTLGGEKSDENVYNNIRMIFPNAKINNIYASTEAGSLFSAKGEFFQIPSLIKDKIKIIENEIYIHKSLLGKSDSFVYTNDYYRTGDLIEWEDQSERLFRFKGRANELINVGGYNINPTEVESVISEISDVIQVIVYGKPNSVLGNILCADIMLKTNSELTEIKLREYLKKHLQDFKVPRRVKFVEKITLTRSGKLKRL